MKETAYNESEHYTVVGYSSLEQLARWVGCLRWQPVIVYHTVYAYPVCHDVYWLLCYEGFDQGFAGLITYMSLPFYIGGPWH